VIDEVIDLVVAVDQCSPVLRLRPRITEKRYRIIVVRNLTYRHFRFNIDGLGLQGGSRAKGLDLAVVEAGWPAKASEAD